MVLNEETKKWASELKNILICDPSLKYISQKKWSWVTNFQKQLSHSCEGSGLKPVGNHVHQGQFTSGMERPLLTATFHCDSCNFEEKVVLKSNGIIELQSQSKGCGPTPLEAVTGVTDTSNTVLNWKTSKKEKNFYTVSVDIQPILDRENPLKYLERSNISPKSSQKYQSSNSRMNMNRRMKIPRKWQGEGFLQKGKNHG